MFCRNCGKEVAAAAELCMNCGAKPTAGKNFCQACGTATNTLAEMCVKCGARLAKASSATGTAGVGIGWQGIKTATLVAWIVALISAIGWGIYLLFAVLIGTFLSALVSPYSGGMSAYMFLSVLPMTIIGLVFLILSGLVFIRVRRMNTAANRGDVDTLKKLNSTGWAVAALLGASLIPGIALLVIHAPIEEL